MSLGFRKDSRTLETMLRFSQSLVVEGNSLTRPGPVCFLGACPPRSEAGIPLPNHTMTLASQVAAVMNPPAKAGVPGDTGYVPGWGRYPGGGNGSPLHYFGRENPMDRGAWRVRVLVTAKVPDMTEWLNNLHS